MMNILRADRDQVFEYGPFSIRRQRPGEAFGPLAIIDQMSLQVDASIPQQTRQNCEIFNYVWRGSLLHTRENGEQQALNARRVMSISAGEGLRYAESAPFVATEMLQAYIQPTELGGEPQVNSFTRDAESAVNSWTLLAGPAESDAPLRLRQAVYVYDLKLQRGVKVVTPQRAGFSTWISVLDGIVRIENERLQQGDSVSDAAPLPAISGERDALLVAFLVKDGINRSP
ncbi:pirin family protein [Pantoea sp.]|uniref:pirin family protein n=1 Tax=Pantoea sp. TaxID=69393 RepID=UPI0031DFF613